MKTGGKKKGTKVAQKKKTRIKMVTARRALDAHAARYARLLMDPCNGPLEHPVYAGADAGFLFRAQSVVTFGTGASDRAGIMHWTPGYVNNNNSELLAAGAVDGVTSVLANTVGVFGPGKSFLNNAYGVRCIAACVRVVYPGTESNRSGRIHFGHTQASLVDASDAIIPDSLATNLQNYTRTPPEALEIIWRPGHADQEFNDPVAAASATLRDRKQSITVTWAGLPAGVGLTFYFTAVYEWTPRPGIGISTNVTGKNPTSNTLDDVIDAVQKTGFKWVSGAASNLGYGLGVGITAAGTAALSRTFGLMPARARRYNSIAF